MVFKYFWLTITLIIAMSGLTFEKDFPNDTTLQSCRFQIGQAYFADGVMFPSQNTLLSDKNQARNSLEQAKKWFYEVIANSGERDTFYLQISKERNRHIGKRLQDLRK